MARAGWNTGTGRETRADRRMLHCDPLGRARSRTISASFSHAMRA